MPARRERPGLRLAIANDASNDQVWIVERRAKGVGKRIAQFPAFMYRPRRFRRHMARNAARERELRKEPLHPFFIGQDLRIDFAVSSLEVCISNQTRTAMPRSGNIDHIEVVLFDLPVQVHVNEVEAGVVPQ